MMYRNYLRNNAAEDRVFMEGLVSSLRPYRLRHEQYTVAQGKRGPEAVRASFWYMRSELDMEAVKVDVDFQHREIYMEKTATGEAVTMDDFMDGDYAARMIRMLYMRPAEV